MNLNPAKIFIAGIVFTATPSVPKPSSLAKSILAGFCMLRFPRNRAASLSDAATRPCDEGQQTIKKRRPKPTPLMAKLRHLAKLRARLPSEARDDEAADLQIVDNSGTETVLDGATADEGPVGEGFSLVGERLKGKDGSAFEHSKNPDRS